MLAGYLHEENCKKYSFDPEKILKETVAPFRLANSITGYLYIKGYFYIHIIEAVEVQSLNDYMKALHKAVSPGGRFQESHKELRVVYQSYESSEQLFKGHECDNSSQASGPILI